MGQNLLWDVFPRNYVVFSAQVAERAIGEHNTTVILCFRIEWHATIISEHQVSCQNGQLYKRQSCHRLPKMNRKAGLRSAPFAESKSPNTIYKYILPHISMNPMTHKLLLSAIRLQNASSRLNNAPRGHYL